MKCIENILCSKQLLCIFIFHYVRINNIKLDHGGEKFMEYKSTIKSRPYLYKETKKVASLINQGVKVNDIKINP